MTTYDEKHPSFLKPIVLYKSFYEDSSYIPIVGESFDVIPVNHPRSYLNGIWTVTSRVVSVDKNGQDFETVYSKYVKA